eukprot:COSAG04_NODE_476_length_13722_cov_16.614707_3_plen_53_part_00
MVHNVWPYVGAFRRTDFLQNEAMFHPHDAYVWDGLVRASNNIAVVPVSLSHD